MSVRASTVDGEVGTERPGPRPLSRREQRIWLLEQLQPGTPLHVTPLLVTVRGPLDRKALREALAALIARHPSLRTVVGSREEGPVATLQPVGAASVELVELEAAEGAAPAARALEEEARRPLDPASSPLLRATLVPLGDETHALLLSVHELGCDPESAPRLLAELAGLYGPAASGEAVADTADIVEWVEPSQRAEQECELAYWRGRLAGASAPLELPADRPRPAVQSFRGDRCSAVLGTGAAAALDTLAHEHGIDGRSALVAALAVVLFRYSGQTDLLIGTRVRVGNALAGGVNTLVLRLDLSDDPGFSQLGRRTQAELASAEAHGSLSFERLVEDLDPERDLSRSPLFQVLVSYGEEPSPAEAGAIRFTAEELFPGATPFDLALRVRRCSDGLLTSTDFSLDLFERETAERVLGHLETLLAGAAAAPDTPVSRLPLLTTAEREELFDRWNATASPYPADRCLHELIADQAAETPEAVAVRGRGEELTYAALEARANRLARHLEECGARPGELVAILVERRPALLVGMLGVLKTGAAYVPFDPTYPPERLAFMLEDAGARLVVSERSLVGLLPTGAADAVLLDDDWPEISEHEPTAPEVAHSSEQLAYVIYTSGSTGRPKGVEIRHRSVVNLLWHMRERPGLGPGDVLVNLTTPAFDLSVPDWYLPLVCGATLVVLPPDATLDADRLARELEAADATFVQATPTTWSMLVDSGWQGLSNLKIVCGGDALPRALADALLDRGASLWHMYGPTETTVWSSIHRLTRDARPPPMGGPIANTAFYVLDERLQPAPPGVPGQLYIGGEGVARGYRNRQQLTAETFVADPFRPGERIYATGDLVRYLPGGTLEFLGRLDHQVKLRGFRIELGEVEAILDEQPGVAASVAMVREDAPGDRRLVAYVVPERGRSVDASALRTALAQRVPPSMVPSAIVELEALPTSANRKVDRTALPPPHRAILDGGRPYQAPRTPVEEMVAEIWQEVLGSEQVGIDDDFFQLGGNSLLATRAVARLRRRIGLPVSLRSIFELPTARLLSADLVRSLAEEAAQEEDLTRLLAELAADGSPAAAGGEEGGR